MRSTIVIAIIIFLITSCKTQDGKSIEQNNGFNTLSLISDSTVLYFKLKDNWMDTTENALDTFVNTWYSKMLFVLREPVLKNYKGDKEIYRFTWLRTFDHPIAIRLEKQGDVVKLFSKVSDGLGGYEPGKIFFNGILNLTQKQVDTINIKLDNANFWTLQTESIEGRGTDGSEWIIEVYKKGIYHVVVRQTPENGTAFRKIGEYLVAISKMKNELIGGDDGDY